MHLGLLSHGQLTFDPFKPIILRGLPTEDASTLFAGNVVLNLSKSTKISNVSVTLKSQAVTYWPEGIGARGNRLTAEKPLGEHTVEILAPDRKAPTLVLQAGTHRFSFAFVIPNSTVATTEDTFGRVRHVVEATVMRPGISMLSSTWHISKPVMILRTYMSNSLLVNNSLATLSRTFEKHMVFGDMEILIEAAAFSLGDLFYIRMIIEPQLKHTRIEYMEVNVTETRRYCVPEMRAWRNDKSTFNMPFAGSVRLAEFGEVDITTDQLAPIFEKNGEGIGMAHDFAHRLAFYTPNCTQNIRHTTYIKEIQFKHHLEINVTISYLDVEGHRQFLSRSTSSSSIEDMGDRNTAIGTLTPPPQAYFTYNDSRVVESSATLNHIDNNGSRTPPSHIMNSTSLYGNNSSNSNNSIVNVSSTSPSSTTVTPAPATQQQQTSNNSTISWQNLLLRLHKTKIEKQDGRRKETITLDTPITVFDCRLKEDYGCLPSYFELGVTPTLMNNSNIQEGEESNNKISYNKQPKIKLTPIAKEKDGRPKPYLCSCYYAFCREMELASQALYLPAESNNTSAMQLLDRIPSIPPPDYKA